LDWKKEWTPRLFFGDHISADHIEINVERLARFAAETKRITVASWVFTCSVEETVKYLEKEA
jgi:hypothetical protein